MSFLDEFKKLFSLARAEPEAQQTINVALPAKQSHANARGQDLLAYSEADIQAVRERAEGIQNAFNESLNIANQSKQRSIREYRLT